MTVQELKEILDKLIQENKGDYTVSLDGYKEVDIDTDDEFKEIRFW